LLEYLKISNSPLQTHVLRYIVLANLSQISLLELVILVEDFVLAGTVKCLPLLLPMAWGL